MKDVIDLESGPGLTTGHRRFAKTWAGKNGTQGGLADVLFEQLAYLLEFADQEGDRLRRVSAILPAAFD